MDTRTTELNAGFEYYASAECTTKGHFARYILDSEYDDINLTVLTNVLLHCDMCQKHVVGGNDVLLQFTTGGNCINICSNCVETVINREKSEITKQKEIDARAKERRDDDGA